MGGDEPSLLERELQKLRKAGRNIPRLIVVHMNSLAEEEMFVT